MRNAFTDYAGFRQNHTICVHKVGTEGLHA